MIAPRKAQNRYTFVAFSFLLVTVIYCLFMISRLFVCQLVHSFVELRRCSPATEGPEEETSVRCPTQLALWRAW